MHRLHKLNLSIGLLFALISIFTVFSPANIQASHSFDKTRIIDDPLFINTNSMSKSQIQTWLNNNAGFLKNWVDDNNIPFPGKYDPNGSRCLAHKATGLKLADIIHEATTDWQAKYVVWRKPNGDAIPASQWSSYTGTIQSCRNEIANWPAYGLKTVAAQTLLVTLQKEQSLISKTGAYSGANIDYMNPSYPSNEYAIAWAMGYGVPDSGGRNHRFVGIYNQVNWAAWQFRYNFEGSKGTPVWDEINMSSYPGPKAGSNYLIDGKQIYMSNNATASLYYYTPHTYPGFYGNYNFGEFWGQWFGTTFSNPVTVTTPDGRSSESGGTARVRFELSQQPTADVTIPLSLSDNSEGSLSGVTEVVITDTSWDNPGQNEVVITGLNDGLSDGDYPYKLVTGNPASTDDIFGDLGATDVSNPQLYNNDNESDIAIGGDWDNDGKDEIALKRGNQYLLNFQNNGTSEVSFRFGNWNDRGLNGDWDNDGYDEIGLQRGNTFFLNYGNNGSEEVRFSFGAASDIGLSGNWDKDGKDEIGLKRGKKYFLNFGYNGKEEVAFNFGLGSDIGLSGDWDGDGKDEIGLKRGNTYFLNYGNNGKEEVRFKFGAASDIPVVGDWDGDGKDEIGLKRGNTYFLNYGNDGKEEVKFSYGR